MTSPMTVQEACEAIAAARGPARAVLTMSAIAYWPEPREDDYRLVGLMGSAAAIGFGLALAQPERGVVVVDGDGSLLMQLGVVAAIATSGVRNLTHVVIDNGIYAISGGQPTPAPASWPGVLAAAGYSAVAACDSPRELVRALADAGPVRGPRAIVARCAGVRPDYPAGAFAVDPASEAARVRAALSER
jgi:phosphonopyruvate decarboxylase